MPLHPKDRLARKVQENMKSDNDITFIEQVPLHPRDRLKRLTSDVNDDMSTINYADDVNIDDVSSAETANYTTTPKKNTAQLQVDKIKKSIKILNKKSMKKIKQPLKNKTKRR